MKKLVIIIVVIAGVAGAAFYSGLFTRESAQAAGGQAPGGRGGAAGRQGRAGQAGAQQGGFPGGGRNQRAPLTVEIGKATRGSVSEQITVVGNLIGDATVSVVPRVAGRL